MFHTILFLILICLIQCVSYTELEKHGSVKVSQPDNRIYFDLSPFEVGELIRFEISIDISEGGDSSKYEFNIRQVEASTYYDSDSWASTLSQRVINKNVSCEDFDDCIFFWDEIKEEGKKYIYIHLPPPTGSHNGYFLFWEKKIKIKHLGGLSDAAIAGIVLGCLAFVGIVAAIIGCCCCKLNPRCYTCCYNCCPCCKCCLCCCKRTQYKLDGTVHVQAQPVVNVIQAPVPTVIPDPYYPPPVNPQPGYTPDIPYSSSAI